MSHTYIMFCDDMFRSDSTIFRSLRAMCHATYSSKCAMGSHLHCSVQQLLKNTGIKDSCVKIWKNVLDGYYPILQWLKLLLKLYVVMPATIQYHTTFTFTSVVRVSLQRSNVCSHPSNYIAGINISSYDAVGNCVVKCLVLGTGVHYRVWLNPLYSDTSANE